MQEFTIDALALSLEDAKKTAENPQEAVARKLELAIATFGAPAIIEALEAAIPEGASIGELIVYRSPELTMLYGRIPPHFQSGIHDHTVFACIAQLTGEERSVVYEPTADGSGLEIARTEVGRPGDVTRLAPDAIHHIENPCDEVSAALHVYGGDFSALEPERSLWTHDHVRGNFSFPALMRNSVIAMKRSHNQEGLDGLVAAMPAAAKLVEAVSAEA